jgi:N-acyl-phosphatidylethanolamine-hydrolysing phospholipase D
MRNCGLVFPFKGIAITNKGMRNGRHENLYPQESHGLKDVLRWKLFGRTHIASKEPFRIQTADNQLPVNSTGDRITWIGHSSFALRIAGKLLLVDPVFSDYCAPLRFKRFRRTAPPGLLLENTPCDGVLITHNHYDHLDRSTIHKLSRDTPYFVPTGLGRWFQQLGRTHVQEFAWWDSKEWAGIRITSVPAQHFSSRTLWDRNRTLWCGWVIEAAGAKIYFAGDTGYCPVFKEIGARFGRFDLAAIPIGAYEPRWFMKPVHVNPEEAVKIHQDVNAKRSIGCHWGTFCLTDEPLAEPPQRLAEATRAAGLGPAEFTALKIGESVSLTS